MAQCSTCGSTVPESVAVCPDCGMELRSASAPAAVTSPAAGPSPEPAPQPVPAPVPTPPASQAQAVTAGARLTLAEVGLCLKRCFLSESVRPSSGALTPRRVLWILTWGRFPKRSMSRGIMLKSGAMLRASGLSKILAQAMARSYVLRASASSRKQAETIRSRTVMK